MSTVTIPGVDGSYVNVTTNADSSITLTVAAPPEDVVGVGTNSVTYGPNVETATIANTIAMLQQVIAAKAT